MLLYAISDRRCSSHSVLDWAAQLLGDGVDLLQIREKDLSGRDLHRLCLAVGKLPNPHGARIVINERADIALAAGLDGVHLPALIAGRPPLRRVLGPGSTIGVSCHRLDEVLAAHATEADFVVFGPVFDPISKGRFGPPVGLAGLQAACRAVPIPVLALGGVSESNASDCLAAGAAGVAGISLFAEPGAVGRLRARGR